MAKKQNNTKVLIVVAAGMLIVTLLTAGALAKKGGGNKPDRGADNDWNYLASLSGGSWDGVTPNQIWGQDIAARTGGGDVHARSSSFHPTTSFGNGPATAVSNGQTTDAPPVVAGFRVTGIQIWPQEDANGDVYALWFNLISPDLSNKEQLRGEVGVVETGVIPGDYDVTLTPDAPIDIRLDLWQKGRRVEGPVVGQLVMGAIEYTPL